MNFGLQNIVAIFLVLATITIGAYFLFFRQQGQYIPETWGELGCIHPIYIKNDDLQPKVQRGVFFSLNQCLSEESIFNTNDIVLFERDGEEMLGVVEGREKDIFSVNTGKEIVEIESEQVVAYTTLPSEY